MPSGWKVDAWRVGNGSEDILTLRTGYKVHSQQNFMGRVANVQKAANR